MASEVDIANRALSMLGDLRIISLDDANKGARAMKARFSHLRDAELAAHSWRFAVTRTLLAASTTVPAYGYSKIYTRPVDDLRPLMVGDVAVNSNLVGLTLSDSGYRTAGEYEIIGGDIHTDLAGPLKYQYIARVTNTGLFDSLFVEALAARLAVDAAEELTQSNTKQQAAARHYDAALREARRINSIYNPPRGKTAGTWLQARRV